MTRSEAILAAVRAELDRQRRAVDGAAGLEEVCIRIGFNRGADSPGQVTVALRTGTRLTPGPKERM